LAGIYRRLPDGDAGHDPAAPDGKHGRKDELRRGFPDQPKRLAYEENLLVEGRLFDIVVLGKRNAGGEILWAHLGAPTDIGRLRIY
jgi:hypothetical protein